MSDEALRQHYRLATGKPLAETPKGPSPGYNKLGPFAGTAPKGKRDQKLMRRFGGRGR